VHDEGCWDEGQEEEDMMDGLYNQGLREKNSRRYKVKGLSINVMTVQLCDIYSFVVLLQKPAIGV
jgi:hypothetical protein